MLEYRTIDNQEYEIEVRYSLGGSNVWGQSVPRGYYLNIEPVERGNGSITKCLTFINKPDYLYILLNEVTRKSKKKELESIEIAKPLIEEHLKKIEEGIIPITKL